MVRKLTVDSSVIISSLLQNETRHKEALTIWENILKGKSFAIITCIFYSVLSVKCFSFFKKLLITTSYKG